MFANTAGTDGATFHLGWKFFNFHPHDISTRLPMLAGVSWTWQAGEEGDIGYLLLEDGTHSRRDETQLDFPSECRSGPHSIVATAATAASAPC